MMAAAAPAGGVRGRRGRAQPVCPLASVIHGREAVVPLLPGGVPNLKLDDGVGDGDGLREEGCADGALLEVEELPLHEAQHQRRLAGAHVAQQHLASRRAGGA